MRNQNPSPHIAVVGGGLAGLTAAAIVARAGCSVAVHERHAEPGGLARSTVKEGFTFNQGPHALYKGGSAERVLLDLGVSITGGQPQTKGLFIFDGQPHIAPAGPSTLLRTTALSWSEKASTGTLLGRLPRMKASKLAGVSVTDWVASATKTDRTAAMLHALVRLATYVNDPGALSAEVAVAQLQLALGAGVMYLDNGWQSLVDQLRARPGVELRSGEACDSLPDADAVIVAVGGPDKAGALLGRQYSVGPAASASCLDLGLHTPPAVNFALGGDEPFYFSNHSAAAKLAAAGTHHVAAVQYLGPNDEPNPDAIADFTRLVGVDDATITTARRLHRMTTVTAIPTAAGGGFAGRPGVTDTGSDNVFIAGDWVGPDGHLADAVLASAEQAAHAALKRTGAVRGG